MALILILSLIASMEKPLPTKQQDIVYEVFMYSFCDSNGDGIGDIPGLITKLDYIRDLGATALWITPVHPSPSYHKYDVMDYYAIDPVFGTMADMDELIVECHRHGLKLIMDLVVNHTSALHPWFVESASSEASPYHDYYVWKDYATVKEELDKKTTTLDSDNIRQWHAEEHRNEHYYGFFWKGMPDLNFDNPAVREEVFDIAYFWIEKGIDGFRLDAAKHIYPDDRLDDTRVFWEEFTSNMHKVKPDIMIIGEVWAEPETLASLFKGLPMLFNFELAKAIPEVVNTGDVQGFVRNYNSMTAAYQAADAEAGDAILLSNHDMNRIRSVLHGDIQKTKLAASILLTMPGTPFIYYGEEIGMLGMKPDEHIREPFLWGKEAKENTHWLKPVYSTKENVDPLDVQQNDDHSMVHHYKKWIRLRNEHPVLSNGSFSFLEWVPGNLLTYSVKDGNEEMMVLHNCGKEKVEFPLPGKAEVVTGGNITGEQLIVVEPYSTTLLLLNN